MENTKIDRKARKIVELRVTESEQGLRAREGEGGERERMGFSSILTLAAGREILHTNSSWYPSKGIGLMLGYMKGGYSWSCKRGAIRGPVYNE